MQTNSQAIHKNHEHRINLVEKRSALSIFLEKEIKKDRRVDEESHHKLIKKIVFFIERKN